MIVVGIFQTAWHPDTLAGSLQLRSSAELGGIKERGLPRCLTNDFDQLPDRELRHRSRENGPVTLSALVTESGVT